LVYQAVAADIAVMACLDPAAGGVVAHQLELSDALAQRSILVDRGRIAVAERQRRMGGGGAQRMDQAGRQRAARFTGAAAIDDQPVGAVAELERQSGGAGALERAWRRRRGSIENE